jgi:hypothetical protein
MKGGWKAFGVTPTDNLVVAIFGHSCSCVPTRLPRSVALNVRLFVSCLAACNKECTLTYSLRRFWSCDTCDTPIDYWSKSRKAGLSEQSGIQILHIASFCRTAMMPPRALPVVSVQATALGQQT